MRPFSGVRLLPVLALLVAGCASSSRTVPNAPPVEQAKVADGVRSVSVYPIIWPDMPAGPNRNLYLANCVACHSQLYVLTQPPFSRKVWTSEVQKMKQSYGAAIEDANIPPIVDYLVAIRGTEAQAKTTQP